MTQHEPTDDENVRHRSSRRRLLRSTCLTSLIVTVSLVGGVTEVWMLPGDDSLLVLGILLLPVWLLIETPVVAFGTLAAIIFALGTYLRWPPMVARLSPARRGFALLAVVFVLHGIWFQFGWAPFRPPCNTGHGPFSLGDHYSLIGPMTPETASKFVDMLNWARPRRRSSVGAKRCQRASSNGALRRRRRVEQHQQDCRAACGRAGHAASQFSLERPVRRDRTNSHGRWQSGVAST